jgi:hypothetical protein
MKPMSFAALLPFILCAYVSHTFSQDPNLQPAPPEIRVIEQPDSPVRLSLLGVRRLDGAIRNITLRVENFSDKGLLAVATRGMAKDEIDAQTGWVTPLRPGHSAGLGAMSSKPIEGERSIAIDVVMFEDGTVWGEDKTGNGEVYKGIRAGRLQLIDDVTEQLRKHDDEALTNFIKGPILAERALTVPMTRFEDGFRRGYADGIRGFRHDLELRKGDVTAISDRLAVLKAEMGMESRRVKRIGKTPTINEVLRIDKLEVRGRTTGFNEAFEAGDDWMRGVVVTLTNISEKRIVSFIFDVNFPETTATGNRMVSNISYGRMPVLPVEVKIAERPAIEPGASVQISYVGETFEKLEGFLKSRHPLYQLSRAEIGVSKVYFDDGTAWSVGTWMRRDENDPRRWIPTVKAN